MDPELLNKLVFQDESWPESEINSREANSLKFGAHLKLDHKVIQEY